MAYIFVLAAVLAAIPILILFKVNLEKLKENPEARGKVQNNFMVGIAVSEIIPILLIIYGFVNMEQAAGMEELYIPGLIILFVMAFSIGFIFLQKNIDVVPEIKSLINSFAMVSMPLTIAVPMISFIALFLMAPQ